MKKKTTISVNDSAVFTRTSLEVMEGILLVRACFERNNIADVLLVHGTRDSTINAFSVSISVIYPPNRQSIYEEVVKALGAEWECKLNTTYIYCVGSNTP